jgi:pilus assembly protein TadC
MLIAILSLAWILGLALLAACVRHFAARQHVQRRLFDAWSESSGAPAFGQAPPAGFLMRWLALAGYRRPGAAAGFVALSAVSLGLGLSASYLISISGLLRFAEQGLAGIPGGLADLLRPILYLAPWMIGAMLAGIPTLLVRRARRRRVNQVERDLPVTLELLATLAEAGLGFDASLERILDAQPAERPLVGEFRTFQLEVLAGRPRVECLRRVARRLDVTAVTILASALVQAEQIGSGVAEVLRSQADDLRQRRRERAIEFSMSLPVKLLFPLVICFLPGIMVFTLGPVLYEFLRFADSFSLNRQF